jgi:hypothetical protein
MRKTLSLLTVAVALVPISAVAMPASPHDSFTQAGSAVETVGYVWECHRGECDWVWYGPGFGQGRGWGHYGWGGHGGWGQGGWGRGGWGGHGGHPH